MILVDTSITAFSPHAEAAELLSSLKYEGDVYPAIFSNRFSNSIDVYGGSIFVSHPSDNVISVIDGDSFSVSSVPVGEYPEGIAVKPFGDLVFVANYESNTVNN